MDYQIQDIETIHHKFQGIIQNNQKYKVEIPRNDARYESFLQLLLQNTTETLSVGNLKMEHGISEKNSVLLRYARRLQEEGALTLEEVKQLETYLRIKRCKSHSGVLVVTIFTSAYPTYITPEGQKVAQPFSCKWNCHYCPNQPGQPRSYLEGEPGVLRANANEFDCCRQMWDRMETLYDTGHPIDKLEVLVLGGTWESYPMEYRKEFIRDMYYAANTFWQEPSLRRTKASLAIERDANRGALCKIIGLTLETRPDTISVESILAARELGCTRFQIGIQHTDDGVLKKINRQCPTSKTIAAIELLKDWGYKVDGHWMPNLPGSSPEQDRYMLVEQLLGLAECPRMVPSKIQGIYDWVVWKPRFPEFQLDQWKIYPCEVVPYTEIEKWHREGLYKPYPEEELEEVLLETKRKVFPWIRLNRIIRDIPTDYIISSGDHPNMRQQLQLKMKKRGWMCACIRCREIKQHKMPETLCYRVREYDASHGTEYFVSAEDSTGGLLCGFVRVRVKDTQDQAWIRELHVYGQLQTTQKKTGEQPATQHKGIGKQLMAFAKELALLHGKQSLWVISGEGTKCYYEKLGYVEGPHGYMVLPISS